MKPSAFDYVRPLNLSDALNALKHHGDKAKILAGGQSLVPMMNLRLAHPEVLVDINRVPGIDHVRVEANELVIGGLARHTTLRESSVVAKACPLMTAAYQHVAHHPIRNRGTIGGNVSHADPASEIPAVLVATDATIVAQSAGASRNIAARGFFMGPLQTALKTGEMVTEVRIPVAAAGQGWAFEEESPRKGDFAIAAIAVTLGIAAGNCSSAAIAVAGMGNHAERIAKVEALLKGKPLTDSLIRDAAALARSSVNPTAASFHADAEYKRDLVEALTERALKQARSRCA
jgi:aerobic carbon-monoxide dehydrogenase medium subunit